MKRRDYFEKAKLRIILILSIGIIFSTGLISQVLEKSIIVFPKEVADLYKKTVVTLPQNVIQQIHNKAQDVSQIPEQGPPPSGDLEAYKNSMKQQLDLAKAGDIMRVMFFVFKEAIEQTNEDKRYMLGRLAEMKQVADSLDDELKELTAETKKLQEALQGTSGCKKNEKDTLGAEVRLKTKAGIRDVQALIERASAQIAITPWPGIKLGQVRIKSSPAPYVIREPRTFGELKTAIETVIPDMKSKQTTLQGLVKRTSSHFQAVDAHAKRLYQMMMDAMNKIRKT